MDYPHSEKFKDKCEECKYYYMIDSGYGWCLRFPPVFRFWFRLLHFSGADMYPEVPWNNKLCGEFKLRS